jgi:hypothetical protein
LPYGWRIGKAGRKVELTIMERAMFVPGQRVECVIDDPDPLGRDMKVKKGEKYTIASVFHVFGQPAVTLVELDPWPAMGWAPIVFRPLTDISVFTEMLKTEKTPEDA